MNGRPWTVAERVLCARAERDGVPVWQVAVATGRSEHSVIRQAPQNRVVAAKVTGERFPRPRGGAPWRPLGDAEMGELRARAAEAAWREGEPCPTHRPKPRPRVVHLPLDPVPEPRPRVPAMPRNGAAELDRLVAEGERRTREYRAREEGRR